MNKETYLAGGYPAGTSKYRMAVKKFGPIPAPVAPVIEKKAVVEPVPIKKTTKKVVKKKLED